MRLRRCARNDNQPWGTVGEISGRRPVMARLGKMTTGMLPLVAALLFAGLSGVPARAAEPIKIGFGMGLTGGLAASGKAALLGMKIWEEETNAKGGVLGRPVQLIYYDDQSNPSNVQGIFTKLI